MTTRDRDLFYFMGFTWVEVEEHDGQTDYEVYTGMRPDEPGDFVATAARIEIDPDGPPRWSVKPFTKSEPKTFVSRLSAAQYLKEALG